MSGVKPSGPSGSGGASSNSFETVTTDTGTSPVADSATDTLDLTSSDSSMSVAGDATADSVDFKIAQAMMPQKRVEYFDDFFNVSNLSGSLQWSTNANSGTIAATATNVDNAHPGVVNLRTSTSATAAPYLITSTGHMSAGGGELTLEFLVRFSNLSDGSETYTARVGFSNAFNASSPADGAWFEYTHSVNSGNWQYKTGSASSYTTSNTASAPTTATWQKLKVVINAAASSVAFYIDGVSVGAAIASNIPAAARKFGLSIGIAKSVGTTERFMYMDYCYFKYVFTTER